MSAPFRLDDRVALVTGGGTGLGLGVAAALAHAGARVVVAGRRAAPLDAAVRSIGERARAHVVDVTDEGDVRRLFRAVDEQFGRVDIVVNNAGIHSKKPIDDTSVTEFTDVLNTHVVGSFLMTREALQLLSRSSDGHVVLIGSMAALMGIDRIAAYTAAKSALVGLTRQMACELQRYGVRVNCILPGWIESPMLSGALDRDPERKRRIMQRIPMQRFGTPDDIGNAVVYLSAPAGRYITGALLPIDGGAAASL